MGLRTQVTWSERGIALFTNTLPIVALLGTNSALTYVLSVGAFGVLFPALLTQWRMSLTKAAGLNILGLIFFMGTLIFIFPKFGGTNYLELLEQQFLHLARDIRGLSPGSLPQRELEEFQTYVRYGLIPSSLFTLATLGLWINFLITFSINPHNFRARLSLPEDTLRTWKTPEWLVWPALLAGAWAALGSFFIPTDQAHNALIYQYVGQAILQLFVIIYALQGISIFGFFFNRWNLNRTLRTMIVTMILVFVSPLAASVGFFDLWFDFRSKFRQEEET